MVANEILSCSSLLAQPAQLAQLDPSHWISQLNHCHRCLMFHHLPSQHLHLFPHLLPFSENQATFSMARFDIKGAPSRPCASPLSLRPALTLEEVSIHFLATVRCQSSLYRTFLYCEASFIRSQTTSIYTHTLLTFISTQLQSHSDHHHGFRQPRQRHFSELASHYLTQHALLAKERLSRLRLLIGIVSKPIDQSSRLSLLPVQLSPIQRHLPLLQGARANRPTVALLRNREVDSGIRARQHRYRQPDENGWPSQEYQRAILRGTRTPQGHSGPEGCHRGMAS